MVSLTLVELSELLMQAFDAGRDRENQRSRNDYTEEGVTEQYVAGVISRFQDPSAEPDEEMTKTIADIISSKDEEILKAISRPGTKLYVDNKHATRLSAHEPHKPGLMSLSVTDLGFPEGSYFAIPARGEDEPFHKWLLRIRVITP